MLKVKREDLRTLPLELLREIHYLLEPVKWTGKEFLESLIAKLAGSSSVGEGTSERRFEFLPEICLWGDRFTAREEKIALDIEKVSGIFKPSGKLQRKLETYEYRKEQEEMAKAVAQALNEEKYLVVEAGAGVGKSWAYLVPAILWTKENQEHFIISTNTKNLQEQLIKKDIPFLRGCLGFDFSSAILKGRNNYVCLRKLSHLLDEMRETLAPLMNHEERMFLVHLLIWLGKSETGDVEESEFFMDLPQFWNLWDEVCSEHLACLANECPYYKRCFVMRAREKAMESEIIVVNHSLLFTDLVAEKHFLPGYKRIVFDEAHNLEKAATTHLGIEVSFWLLNRLLNRISRKEGRAPTRILGKVMQKEKGLTQRALRLLESLEAVRDACQQFFNSIEANSELFPFDEVTNKLRLIKGATTQVFLSNRIEEFLPLWNQFFHQMGDLAEEVVDATLARDIKSRVKEGLEISLGLNFIKEAEEENFVYWMEKDKGVKLCASPLEVGEYLHNLLYSQIPSLIFCSATLTVDGSFKFFCERTGLDLLPEEKLTLLLLGSPFDYEKQVMFNIATYLPSPKEEEKYSREIAETISKILDVVGGKTLILFTSYKMLNEVYEELKSRLRLKFQILGQGIDGPRTIITQRFKEDLSSILLGTHSFWEGVDLPGRVLECLIVTRLPFAVPAEPIEEARVELIENRGGDGFAGYSLPCAVIRLRQGIGRLVRTRSDKGVVVLLDKRIITKNYGKRFLQSIPIVNYHLFNSEERLLTEIAQWFKGESFNCCEL